MNKIPIKNMLVICICLAVISTLYLFTLNGLHAQDKKISEGGAEARVESLKDFILANPDCLEVTDQCSVCLIVDGEADCSVPKIACIKKPYQCTNIK